jgi:hypothetical protein
MAKSSGLLWGILWILIGFIFLMNTLGYIDFSIWRVLWRLWPVFLIVAGISMVLPDMKWPGTLLSIAVIIILVIIFIPRLHPDKLQQITMNQPIEGIEKADVQLNFGAGNIYIAGRSDDLMQGVFGYSITAPVKEFSAKGNNGELTLSTGPKSTRNDWNMTFNGAIPLNLEINFGAANSNIDLSAMEVDKLAINGGAISTKIRFAKYPTKAEIKVGASDVSITLPKDYSARLKVESGLTSVSVENLDKENDYYYTANYDPSEDFIDIKVSAGVSSIKVIQ